jgi:hypothetical protein
MPIFLNRCPCGTFTFGAPRRAADGRLLFHLFYNLASQKKVFEDRVLIQNLDKCQAILGLDDDKCPPMWHYLDRMYLELIGTDERQIPLSSCAL